MANNDPIEPTWKGLGERVKVQKGDKLVVVLQFKLFDESDNPQPRFQSTQEMVKVEVMEVEGDMVRAEITNNWVQEDEEEHDHVSDLDAHLIPKGQERQGKWDFVRGFFRRRVKDRTGSRNAKPEEGDN